MSSWPQGFSTRVTVISYRSPRVHAANPPGRDGPGWRILARRPGSCNGDTQPVPRHHDLAAPPCPAHGGLDAIPAELGIHVGQEEGSGPGAAGHACDARGGEMDRDREVVRERALGDEEVHAAQE